MKNQLLFFFLLSGFSFSVNGQALQVKTVSFFDASEINVGSQGDLLFFKKSKGGMLYSEDQYLNQEWQPAIILTSQKKQYDIYVKYRLEDAQVEFYFGDNAFELVGHSIKAMKFDNKIFLPLECYSGISTYNEYRFFELLTDARRIKLVRQIDGKKNPLFYHTKGLAEPLELKKKTILELLKDRKLAIRDFVKMNKLSYRKAEDVIRIFDFYEIKTRPFRPNKEILDESLAHKS